MRTACPNCHEVYDIEDQYAATEVPCPDCGHPFVPADLPPPAPPAFVPPPETAAPAAPPAAEVPPAEPSPRTPFTASGMIADVVFGVLCVLGLFILAAGASRDMELQAIAGISLVVSSVFALALFSYLKQILAELRRRR